jgi:hypothetical protein
MNEYEKACKEFLEGCSIAGPNSVHGQINQEDCPECLRAFCSIIRNLKKQEDENISKDRLESACLRVDFIYSKDVFRDINGEPYMKKNIKEFGATFFELDGKQNGKS